MNNSETLNTAIQHLESWPVIKIHLFGLPLEEIPDNPTDFLFKFITKFNYKYSTFDDKNKKITDVGRRRSVNETYHLMLNYFPDYKIEDYFRDIFALISRVYDETLNQIMLHWCPDIKREVIGCLGAGYWGYTEYNSDYYGKCDHFPYPFVSGILYDSVIWPILKRQEIIKELLGDKYVIKNKN